MRDPVSENKEESKAERYRHHLRAPHALESSLSKSFHILCSRLLSHSIKIVKDNHHLHTMSKILVLALICSDLQIWSLPAVAIIFHINTTHSISNLVYLTSTSNFNTQFSGDPGWPPTSSCNVLLLIFNQVSPP